MEITINFKTPKVSAILLNSTLTLYIAISQLHQHLKI